MRLPKWNVSAPKLHRRLESVFSAMDRETSQSPPRALSVWEHTRQTDVTAPRREPQSLSCCLPPLCPTRIPTRLCGPSGESVREQAGQRSIGSLDSVACVDTATRRNQHQKWRNHGYKESVTMNECLSECWTLCARGCNHRASTEWQSNSDVGRSVVGVVTGATSFYGDSRT